MFSPKFLVNANEASKNVDVINENFRNIKIDLEYLNDLDKRISDIDARTKCVNPERIRRDYLSTKSELNGKLYGSISYGRIPQKDHLNANKLKDTSWEAYYEHLQPVNDNESDIGQSLKRVKTAYAYVVNALTGIYRAGLELASVFAPISHASNSTTYGIADASNYGHVKSSITNPLMDGVADPGTAGALVANYNHRHPTDTSREPVHTRSDITAATDFRTLDVGCYRVSGGTWHENNPGTGVYNWGIVWVDLRGSNERIVIYKADVVPGNSSGGLWVDIAFGGIWRGWHQIASKQYLDTVYESKSGDDTTINTSNANGSISGNVETFINTATFTASRTWGLPQPSVGKRLCITNNGSSTTYDLIISPGAYTLQYGISNLNLKGGSAAGLKGVMLRGQSSTVWAVVGYYSI